MRFTAIAIMAMMTFVIAFSYESEKVKFNFEVHKENSQEIK